jgi:hypothetical protein
MLLIPQQAIGRMAFEVIPELLGGIEFRGIGGELLQMQPGMGLLHGLDRRSTVNAAAIPEEDDMVPQMPQERTQEIGHGESLKVVRLPTDV